MTLKFPHIACFLPFAVAIQLLQARPARASESCELLEDKFAPVTTTASISELLPQSRNLELLRRAQLFVPKSRIETGMKLADYLRRYMPTRFRQEFAREFSRVLSFLESGEIVGTFKPLRGAEAVYSPARGELSVNTLYGNRVSPVRLFLDIAHEFRHAITRRVYRPKHKFVTEKGMSKEAFLRENMDPILSDEAISYYEQMIFISRLSRSDYFRPFAAETIYESGILRDIAAEIAKHKPAAGRETLEVIKRFVIREPAYHELFTNALSRVYDHYQEEEGGIVTLNGTEYWY